MIEIGLTPYLSGFISIYKLLSARTLPLILISHFWNVFPTICPSCRTWRLSCRVAFARFACQKIWFSSRSANPIWSEKNHKDDRFSFLKIPSSSVFVLALKFPQISQNSAKSCVVLLQKEQLLVLENHDFCKNRIKCQSISYVRACEKAD